MSIFEVLFSGAGDAGVSGQKGTHLPEHWVDDLIDVLHTAVAQAPPAPPIAAEGRPASEREGRD